MVLKICPKIRTASTKKNTVVLIRKMIFRIILKNVKNIFSNLVQLANLQAEQYFEYDVQELIQVVLRHQNYLETSVTQTEYLNLMRPTHNRVRMKSCSNPGLNQDDLICPKRCTVAHLHVPNQAQKNWIINFIPLLFDKFFLQLTGSSDQATNKRILL